MQPPTASYQYPHLADNSIRVLQLLPNPDRDAPIQCRLTHCPLPDVLGQNGSCLFEALSYVWGSNTKDRSVFVLPNDARSVATLNVTASLHEALVRLRDPWFERLLWADAICINQEDWDERECQVRIMERVYASASRVLVWLGNDEERQGLPDGRVNALESLRLAALGLQPSSEDSFALSTLLERPWFTRMWVSWMYLGILLDIRLSNAKVLQEVAAARHVLMMYGPVTIDGQAFCLGLETLLPLIRDEKLQWIARSTAQLIQGAALRPRLALQHPRRGFHVKSVQLVARLGSRPLGELMDMFHDRKATMAHDRIYALLGICTDTVADVLLPDYTVSWSELFRRLILYLLGTKTAAVKTWDDADMVGFAVVKVASRLIGEVVSVGGPAAPPEGTRLVTVGPFRVKDGNGNTGEQWAFRSSSDFIRKGDFVCAVEGRPTTMIVRYHNADYFSIVCINGPSADTTTSSESSTRRYSSLLCIWDWKDRTSDSTEDLSSLLRTRVASDPAGVLGREVYRPEDEIWRTGIMVLPSQHLTVAVNRCLQIAGDGKETRLWLSKMEHKLLQVLDWATDALGMGDRFTYDATLALSDVYEASGDIGKAENFALRAYASVYGRGAQAGEGSEDDNVYSDEYLNGLLNSPWSNVNRIFDQRLRRRGQDVVITPSPSMVSSEWFTPCRCTPSLDSTSPAVGDTENGEGYPTSPFNTGPGCTEAEIFPAVVLGMRETKLNEDAAFCFARSPKWVLLALERNKIPITFGVLGALMHHRDEEDSRLRQIASAAAVAFVLVEGNTNTAGDMAAEAFRHARSQKFADVVDYASVGENLMISAATHPHGAWILGVLTEHLTIRKMPAVTEKVMLAAVANSDDKNNVITALREICSSTNAMLPVTEEVVVAALQNPNASWLIDSLTEPHGTGIIPVTEKTAIAGLETGDARLLQRLIPPFGADTRLRVTESIALKLASIKNGNILMRYFPWKGYADKRISENVVTAALANGWVPFLPARMIELHDSDVEYRGRGASPRLEQLLQRIELTDEYLIAVSSRLSEPWASDLDTRRRTIGELKILLRIKGMQVLPPTEAAVTIAVQLALCKVGVGSDMLGFMLQAYGNALPVTEAVVIAAASMGECGKAWDHHDEDCVRKTVVKLLLDKENQPSPVSDRVLEAAVRSQCFAVVQLLLEKGESKLRLTNAALALAAHDINGQSLRVWRLLMDSKEATLEVTEGILLSVAYSCLQVQNVDDTYGAELLGSAKTLLQELVERYQRQRGSPTLPEKFIAAAARRKSTFRILRGIKGSKSIRLTKDLVLDADPNVLAILLDRHMEIPETAVVDALLDFCKRAASRERGLETHQSMYTLLGRYGERWLQESPAIRASIVRLAWYASDKLLHKMLRLMPSLPKYVQDADLPERRKMRLLRWVMESWGLGPGYDDEFEDWSDGESDGSSGSESARDGRSQNSSKTKLRLLRWFPSRFEYSNQDH